MPQRTMLMGGVCLLLLAGSTSRSVAATDATTQPTTTQATTRPSPAAAKADQIVKWLSYVTQDNALATRKSACADMLASGWPEAIDALVTVLTTDGDANARLAVCAALSDMTDPPAAFVQPLLSRLDDPDANVREAVGVALGLYPDDGVVSGLAALVMDDAAPHARRLAAVQALANVQNTVEGIDALLAALDVADPHIRGAVVKALQDVTAVSFGYNVAAWRAWWAQGRDELVASLSRKLRSMQRQYNTLESSYTSALEELIDKTPPEARDARLLQWLTAASPAGRRTAVRLVGRSLPQMPSEPVLVAVRRLLTDSDPHVRAAVIEVLRDLRDPATDAAPLEAMVATETDPFVKPVLYNALGRLGSPASLPLCVAALDDPDPDVVAEAVTALGFLVQAHRDAADAEVDVVVKAILDRFSPLPDDATLRRRVVDTIAKMQDARFAAILRAEAGPSQKVAAIRLAAVRGLALLGDGANADVIADALADPDGDVRRAAAEAMERLGHTPKHLDALGTRLNPSVEPVKQIQSLVWEAYRAAFGRLDSPASQLEVLSAFPWNHDAVAAERFVQLVRSVEQPLLAQNPPPEGLGVIYVRLGDALAMTDRDVDAVRAYERALTMMASAPVEQQQSAVTKLLAAYLRAGQLDQAIAAIEGKNVTTRPSQQDVTETVGARLDALLAAKRSEEAIALIDRLSNATHAFGPAWLERLAGIRAHAVALQQEQDREAVHRYVADLRAGGDAATRASVEIKKLGPRAVEPLRDELQQLLTTGENNADLERVLLDVLKTLVPTWPGYDPASTSEQKLQALKSLSLAP